MDEIEGIRGEDCEKKWSSIYSDEEGDLKMEGEGFQTKEQDWKMYFRGQMEIEKKKKKENPSALSTEVDQQKIDTVQKVLIIDCYEKDCEENNYSVNSNLCINPELQTYEPIESEEKEEQVQNLFRKDSYEQDYYNEHGNLIIRESNSNQMNHCKLSNWRRLIRQIRIRKRKIMIRKVVTKNETQKEAKDRNLVSKDEQQFYPGERKNIPKTVIESMQKFIKKQFKQNYINHYDELSEFLNPGERNIEKLKKFFNTSIGYQVCQFYFGNYKFVKSAIKGKRANLELQFKGVKINFAYC